MQNNQVIQERTATEKGDGREFATSENGRKARRTYAPDF